MADISIINKDNTNYYVKDAVGREALAVVENKGAKNLLKLGFTTKTVGTQTATMTADGNGIVVNGDRNSSSDTILVYDLSTNESSMSDTRYALPVGSYVIAPTGTSTLRIQVYCHDGSGVNSERLGQASTDAVSFEYTSALKTQYPYIAYRLWASKVSSFSNLTIYPMVCSKAEWDISQAYVPYCKTNAELTVENASQQSEIDYAVNAGAKNLAPIETRTNKTNNKWIVGPGSGNSEPINLIAGDYIFTAVSSSTGSGQCQIKLVYNDGTTALTTVFNFGSTMVLKFTAQKDVVGYGVYSNAVPVTFEKMMIRSAAITDPTFQPYARTNPELTVLTDEDRASLVEIVDGGAKNVANWSESTQTINNVVFTVYGDTVTVTLSSGTQVSERTQKALNLASFDKLPAGTYVLAGAPTMSGGGLYVWDNTAAKRVSQSVRTEGDGVEFDFSPVSGHSYHITVDIPDGYTITSGDSLIFRPMICTKAAWRISHEYQPYRPSWQEGCFGRGSMIKSTDDCNNFTEVGTYYAGSSISVPALNSPFQGSGFRLRVEDWYQYQDGITGKIQIADTYINVSTYIEKRRIYFYTGGGVGWRWTEWTTTISQSMTPA